MMGALRNMLQTIIAKALRGVPSSIDYGGRGWTRIHEPYSGAWQRNDGLDLTGVSAFHADFACKTLIARDIAKLRLKLVELDSNGIWTETTNPAFSPVLRKPNPFQTRNQFWEDWFLSKLSRGNTYVFKRYDNRNIVTAMFVLDPNRVQPLVADDGSVFYRLNSDNLLGLPDEIIAPARNIIHDRMNCLFHPLCGIPPIYASALAACQGLNIQTQSARLFRNASTPGGTLTAPGPIPQDVADRTKQDWEINFGGDNVGRIAVLQNGLKYEKISFTAEEGQLIEQLKYTAEVVCSTYHVPPYKIGVGPLPSYNNVQALNVEYFSQGLQSLIEEAEECLDEGLGIGWGVGVGTEFDVDNLLRMDTMTQVTAEKDAVGAGIKSPNESRRRFDLPPVEGGGSPYLQQQNYSLAALAKRDAQDDPFGSNAPSPPADDTEDEPAEDDVAMAQLFAWEFKSQLDAMTAARIS